MPSRPPSTTLFPYTTLFRSEDHQAGEFPEVRDCFMIYGGQVANASARHRKQERREVCSVKVAAPVYLDWSDKPTTFDRDDHHDRDRKSTRLNSSHMSISYAVSTAEYHTLSLHDALPI